MLVREDNPCPIVAMVARLAALLFVVLLGACASLPTEYAKEPSTAIRNTGDTQIGQKARPLAAAHPGKSGFYLLSDGVEALAARLVLAQRAEVSIDVQYYIILPDITGDLLLGQLVEAANRGVRVRILLDDIETKGYELMFAVLSAKPNIEIRLMNPFANRRVRVTNFVADFRRLNHRMHNKSITFDNAVTILGGRNIGAEYFGASDAFNYRDLDVLGTRPVANQVSSEFDTYWNAPEAVPVTAFVEPDDSAESAEKAQQRFTAVVEAAKTTPYAGALKSSIVDLLLSDDASQLVWAPARVVFDLPYSKPAGRDKADTKVLTGILITAAEKAVKESVCRFAVLRTR